MAKTRRKLTAAFKAKVAIESLKERETLSALAARFEVTPTQISTWKKEFLANASLAFGKDVDKAEGPDVTHLYTKIGQMEMEPDFFKKVYAKPAFSRTDVPGSVR